MRGFSSVSMIPVFGIQFIADISLEGIRFVQADAAVPDELVIRFQRYCQLILDTRGLLLMFKKPADKILCSLRRSFCPFVITQVQWVGLIFQNPLPVFFQEVAQDESFGLKFHKLSCSRMFCPYPFWTNTF